MPTSTLSETNRQVVLREMVFGSLIYTVVLGFFNDYTEFLQMESYSSTFAVAVVMQILTYLTLQLKNSVVAHFKKQTGRYTRLGLIISVWLIMFLSKFLFLEVLNIVFGDAIEISGFVSLAIIIVTMTLTRQIFDYAYNKLAD